MSDLPYNPENMKALIVDDHELIRKSIAKVMRKIKFKDVFECSTEKEAIDLFTKHVIDIVFCDIFGEKSDGFALLRYIRAQETNSDIPFIVVTGEAGKEDIVKTANLGVEEYMLKPFHPSDLEKKTHQVLTKYHSPTPLLHHIRKAERSRLENDLETAVSSIQEALAIDPTSPRANHYYGVILDAMHETKRAIAVISDNIAKNPSFLKNYVTLADMHLRENDIPSAIRALRNELSINPKQARRQAQLAKLLYHSGDFEGSIAHYRQALLEEAKDPAALFEIGKAFAAKDNLEKAIYYFKRLRRYHPDNTQSLEAIVTYSLKCDSARVAEMALIDEKKSFPARLDTYVILAKLYVKLERFPDALSIIDEALKKGPDYIEGLKVRAALLLKMNDEAKAIDTYYQIVARSADVDSHLKLAEILIAKESFFDAITILQHGLKSGEESVKVLYWLSVALTKTKQYTKAYFTYKKIFQAGFKDSKVVNSANKLKEMLLVRRQNHEKAAS